MAENFLRYKYLIVSDTDGVRGTDSDDEARKVAAEGEHHVIQIDAGGLSFAVAQEMSLDFEPLTIERL